MMTKEELIEFEDEIAEYFNNAMIKAPVHLYHGNEEQMIDVFKKHNIGKEDWVLCSWRSHYQCLLKGVPKEELKKAILEGRSISLSFKEDRVLCSGIVTGQLSVSVGLALGIKRSGGTNKVYCFMGEMTSETGAAHECIKYARNHKLPIHFIVEDNGKSVCTDTRATWAMEKMSYEDVNDEYVTYYKYDLDKYPHAGAGVRVQF
jgi:TPP-dependent pyruvate/acetoin dehydrogenase alpha subunit|tara:strand:- start:3706 stop:4317 length:612 start_codon:yes stop_codon:yes gene_type:complete